MNLNDKEEDLFFNQRCLELAKLLRSEQTEDFLHLYDSLPSEWNGSRLETAKEYIRQLQELEENEFEVIYQRVIHNREKEQNYQTIMSNLPRQTADEHKYSSSIKRNNDETNPKTRRLQSITNNNTHDMIQNNCRTRTPVDSFVQLNLKPAIDITLEDYKKAKVPNSSTKGNIINNRPCTTELNQVKKHKISMKNKSHEEACFGYFSNNNNDDDDSQHSRSSSSSSTTNQITLQSNLNEHSKLIPNNDFDSHGSSIATKSSSDNSGSARTGSGSDSDQSGKNTYLSLPKTKQLNTDDTPTIVLNQTSENRTNSYDYNSSLPKQDSYELVTNDEHHVFGSQVSRFKLSVPDDPNGLNNSNNDTHSYTAQRSQQNNLPSSSSHQNRNPEHHEQYNTNHSNSSRKPSRPSKKRKQLQQQEIIRTELIPGHRGDRDVDELVMFIDGNSSSKQRQQNSAPLRLTDTNKFKTTSSLPDTNSNHNTSISRRKSRKPTKLLEESLNNNENKTLQIDDDIHSIGFIDADDETTHSINTNLPSHNDESHSLNDSNTTNGETSLPEWLESHDNISSTILNNSNSEILSEPFVTVTHRRRLIKERRQDNYTKTSSSITNDKRRFQSTQNGTQRPTIRNSLSNIKPFVSTTKEDNTNITSPPSQPTSQTSIPPPPPTVVPEQSSPRLSSHSSSSSLSSLLKRQSKAPPVVFLNKSIDIELNDVSFGFDVENSPIDQPLTPTEKETETETNNLSSTQSNDQTTNSKSTSSSNRRSYQQQRNNRGPLFYSGSDIRPQHHRNYPSQPPPVSQSPYIHPLLLFQYNQQRYSQQIAYMNLLRSQYLSSQSPYVLIPTIPQDDKTINDNDESIQPTEPLLVYTTIPTQSGEPIYLHSNKKESIPNMYPPQYFYPTHSAYFQPITSPSLLIDTKSQHDTEEEEEDDVDNDYDKSTKLYHQTRQSSSSNIMSNALQLVYSQEKRNAQTDRFNLDQLTAYLAMKWTDTIDHYEQGDDEILLTGE